MGRETPLRQADLDGTRAAIVTAALDILDEQGVEAHSRRRLETLLHALSAPAGARERLPVLARPPLLQIRIAAIVRAARERIEHAWTSATHVIPIDRRILLLIEAHGDLPATAVAASLGLDKAQISRAVARMRDARLIGCDRGRAPLRLTPEGAGLARRVRGLADAHDATLTFGIDGGQRTILFDGLHALLARAIRLFHAERGLIAAERGDAPAIYPLDGIAVMERAHVLPALVSLHSYLTRSAALAFKRCTGLSNFEAHVLAEICRAGPMVWSHLVDIIDRDRSQTFRTIKQLIALGLIERAGDPTRRSGLYAATVEGRRVDAIAGDAIAHQNTILAQALPRRNLGALHAMLSLIARNAGAPEAGTRALYWSET